MRVVRAGLAITAMIVAASSAQADSVTLQVVADPADRAEALKLFGSEPGFREQLLHDDVPDGGVMASVDLPPGAVEASLIVVWSDNRQTSFPLMLASSFANQVVEVHLLERASATRPTSQQVRRACDQSAPAGISPVFEMLFTCKGFALALEEAGEDWDPDHRLAMSGWLVANYRLASLGNRVSPYGLDPDLRSRLEEALERGRRDGRGDDRWVPLRLADARALIELTDTRPIRMAGFVPDLLQQGAVREARNVNAVALQTIQTLQPAGAIDGINERVLLENQILLDNLLVR
jgi:hypothetical protein